MGQWKCNQANNINFFKKGKTEKEYQKYETQNKVAGISSTNLTITMNRFG